MKNEIQKIMSAIPKVDRILEHESAKELLCRIDKPLFLKIVSDVLDEKRRELTISFKNKTPLELPFPIEHYIDEIRKKIDHLLSDKLVHVINATGTILHTNLGRAPLSVGISKKIANISSCYSNLELDLHDGKRGSRYSHFHEIVKLITGAEDVIAVNNNAAAVLLALNTFSDGREAIVSRGELIEIGGAFRIPEVMKKSHAILREVGTTNKTHLGDYEEAISENTGLLLKVHTSNYKIVGFTKEVTLGELVALGRERDVPVYNDIGSGCLIDLSKYGLAPENTVQEALLAGADIVSFSGDKLLGGPQAGIIVGKKKYIEKIRENPLTRALRLDKMTLFALEQTFKRYLNVKDAVKSLPALKMIAEKKENIKKRCDALIDKLKVEKKWAFTITAQPEHSFIGGGARPLEKLDTYALVLKSKKISSEKIAKSFREHTPPIIVRINDDAVILDMRTILKNEDEIVLNAIKEIFKK